MPPAISQSVANYLNKGVNLDALRMACRRLDCEGKKIYLYGLLTGLNSFLRIQGHESNEINAALQDALTQIAANELTLSEVAEIGEECSL